jgi:hypothetical protein
MIVARVLRSRGIPVPLGGRAFEVITVLVQSASEFVTKDHLMERVWPSRSAVRSITEARNGYHGSGALTKTTAPRGNYLIPCRA